MLKQLLSVFLKSPCVFCDRPSSPQSDHLSNSTFIDDTFCEYCQAKLRSHRFTKEQLSQDQFTEHNSLNSDPSLSADIPVFAWGKYEGQLKRAIALMKYHNNPEIGKILGWLLGQAWLEFSPLRSSQKLTVVPIPLHQEKLKARGFNQAKIIARGFCSSTGYTLNSQALVRVKNTKALFDLSPEERTKNLKDAFRAGSKLPKQPVLLLDDVYTMGTTIRESAMVLQKQNIQVDGAIVIAKAQKT